jgi:uncharacterized membrane protein YdbT with pleckstrin-like domain
MPDINSAQFRSCTSKVDVLEAVLCLMAAATALIQPRGWMIATLLLCAATWLCVRAYRDRGRPYVEVRDGRLTIHARRKILQEIDLTLLAGVRKGWNKTILLLRDGRKVAVDHAGFATGEEADRFRKLVTGSSGAAQA